MPMTPYSSIYQPFPSMKIANLLKCVMANAIIIIPETLIIFIFESQAGVLVGVWSRVELRHEYGPIYKFHIHNP